MSLVLVESFRRLCVHGEDFKVEGDVDNRKLDCRLPTFKGCSSQIEARGEGEVVLPSKCLHFLLLHLCSNLLSVSRWSRNSMGGVVMMLDQNLVVLHNVLFSPIWDVAKLVLGIDLANSVAAFHLGSDDIKRLPICRLSSLHSILGNVPTCSSFP